jgi:hypothetical protein
MQLEHQLGALCSRHEDPLQPRTSREANHRFDNAFPCRDDTGLQHSVTTELARELSFHVSGERLGRFSMMNPGYRVIAPWGCAAHIEFENVRHHDDGLRSIAVLEHRKFQSFSAINKKASAQTLSVPNNLVAAAVLADKELAEFRIARGRFAFVHDSSP